MIKRKRFRERGKVKLSEIFKQLQVGDKVMLRELPGAVPLPPQFRGKTGTIEGKSGKAFIVKFLNGKVVKRLTLKPEYLKRLK